MNDQLIIILEENTSSSYPKWIQPPMDLNLGVTLQLRFGTLFPISSVSPIISEHLRTWCPRWISQILHLHLIYYFSRRFYPDLNLMFSPRIWLVYKQWNWEGFSSAQKVLFQGNCRVLIRPWILFAIKFFANPRVTNRIQSNAIRSSPIPILQYGAWKVRWRPDVVTSATPVMKTKTSFPSWLTSKVSLLAVVDRTERQKGRKFTKRSQTSRKSAKRMCDFPVREERGTVRRGPGGKKLPC